MADPIDAGPPGPLVVGVVIPAYRVASLIGDVVRGIPPLVRHIIVVDDASPDGTAAVVAALAEPRLTLVRHAVNQGVGGAVLTGYEAAVQRGCEVLVKIDGDGQMDPARIPDLIAPLQAGRADYAKGNRFLDAAELGRMPLPRRYGNIALTFLTKCASGYWGMFDPTNGFTALHAEAWRRIRRERIDRRYFFESSLLIELGCVRAVVEDVAIPARYGQEVSSLSIGRTLLEFPLKLLAGLCRRLTRWYFLYDFTPVSLYLIAGPLLLAFASAWGGYHWWHSLRTGVPATTGTVMLAVVALILGVQLLLQALALDMQSAPRLPLAVSRRRRGDQAAGRPGVET